MRSFPYHLDSDSDFDCDFDRSSPQNLFDQIIPQVLVFRMNHIFAPRFSGRLIFK
jgi:hypothetical protein